MRPARLIFLFAVLVLGGCQAGFPRTTDPRGIGLSPPADEYAAVFPYYAELCAASQFRKRPGIGVPIEGGGFGGHEVLYLNGACRAATASATTLALCDPKTQGGVGLSVNAHYENANWVATAPRDFFFHGTLKPGAPLTLSAYRETLAAAQAMGFLDGVVFHEEVFAGMPPGMSRRDYMYELSLGTDYALNQARDRYCARVPLERAQMAAMIDYLNAVNAPYREGRQRFRWNVFRDNCSHLVRNALAAAGVARPFASHQAWPLAVLRFPVPKNEFVNMMRRTNDLPLEDLDALFEDRAIRNALLQGQGLPTRPGALAELERIASPNAVYDLNVDLVFYDDVVTGRYQRHFARILSTPRYSDLAANLRYFAEAYRRIEAVRRPLASYTLRPCARNQAEFALFYQRYYDEIARRRAETERALRAVEAASARE